MNHSLLLLFWTSEIERPRVIRARKESDELFVRSSTDPVEHATIFSSEVCGSFEHHNLTDLSAFHLDRVFIGPPTVAFKGRFPDAILIDDLAAEALAQLFDRACSLRRIVNSPRAYPITGYIGNRFFRFGLSK